MSTPVSIRASVQTSLIREGTLEGVSYIVAPVVMMVGDAVIRSLGSEGPEFVPLRELERAPESWNYRPVVMSHPTSADGAPQLACDVAVLERTRFGYVFNARIENGKLAAEMWLDPIRASVVGADAVQFVKRVKAGEVADVSVGALVAIEKVEGRTAKGESYSYVWHDLAPDHLAGLPLGTPGACSVELGCGTPRAAAAITQKGGELMKALQRLLAAVFAKADKGESDATTRDRLHTALFSNEAGFDSVYEVYPASQTVIFTVYRDSEYRWLRAEYTMNEDGTVTLGIAEEVMPTTSFEPVSAVAAVTDVIVTAAEPVVAVAPVAACGCGGNPNATVAPAQEGASKMSEVTQKVKDLAGALITCAHSPFKEEDRAGLEAMTETRLSEFAASFSEPAKVETPAPAPAAAAQTEEQWLESAGAPASVRSLIARAKVEEKARHASLVGTLKTAQSHYNEDQLVAMPVEKLEELAAVLGTASAETPDFSGRVISAPASVAAVADHNKTFADAIAARKAAAGRK